MLTLELFREQILVNQRINGKQLDEETIASMIDQARVIEQDYGHLFDEIIINHNTDDTYEVTSLSSGIR